MSSEDRSGHKRGLHKTPPGSRRATRANPASRSTSVRRRNGGVCDDERSGSVSTRRGRTRPSGSPERHARAPRGAGAMTQPGAWGNQPGTVNRRRGPRGKPPEPAKNSRGAPGSGRGMKASEPSEPPPSRRSSREQRLQYAQTAPFSTWMASTRPARRSGSAHRTSPSARSAV
jgi:hypothetical protein